MTSPARLAVSMALALAATPGLAAQRAAAATRWGVGLSAGMVQYWGGTTEEATDEGVLRFTPYRPAPIGVRLEYGADLRVGLALEYAEPGLAGRGAAAPGQPAGGTIVLERYPTTLSLTATLTRRIARVAGGGSVRSGFGFVGERWEVPGEPARRRAVALALVGIELPLFGGWAGSVTGSAGVGASPFRAAELPAPFRPAALWRRGLTGAVAYRF